MSKQMPHPIHTPYDGSTPPFTIALRSLDPNDWIEVDARLPDYLTEKDQLFTSIHSEVFAAESNTHDAQQEVLDLLHTHLPQRYPDIYSASSESITILATGSTIPRHDDTTAPLERAARLIQDDLVIMRPGDRGHRLVAAALCFPSSWSLAEKFGHPLADIHGPVPGFNRGTKTAEMIERIFSNLKSGLPVERYNWSIYDHPRLHYQTRNHGGDANLWNTNDPRAWIRIERQTLSRLPASGDILFTIKIYVDPFATLRTLPNSADLARSFAEQIAALDADQLTYKNLARDQAQIIAALDTIASTT